MPTTVILADDHVVVRRGLHLLLDGEDDLEVVGEAGDVSEALDQVSELRPDVLVLDLNMPGEPSLPAIPRFRRAAPRTGIVILTMQSDPAFAREALRAGAQAYVLKEAADDELVEAIRSVARGETYLNPHLGAQLAADRAGRDHAPDDLSDREVEVLRLIALGHTNSEIAELLTLSTRTVESHRAHIQRKLGRSSRAELVRYALDRRLIQPAVH